MINCSKPSILFHRGTRWKGPVRGSTNVLASFFLRAGYPVSWLTRPFHFGHVLRGPRDHFPHGCSTWSQRHSDGALEISPFTVAPILKTQFLGQKVWEYSAQLGYRTIYPDLQRVFEDEGQPQPELIWTTGGDGGALRHAFPNARRIVQCVDIYEAYAGSVQNRLEVTDYDDADAVVAIGHALAKFLAQERGVPEQKISMIGQGADLDLFMKEPAEPSDLSTIPHPRLIWVGVLDKADPGLMASALAALPNGEGSLILVGPETMWARNLAERDSRVFLSGPRPAREVAAYLLHSDVGLMLYDRKRVPLQYLGQNPLKLYEMAAARLPIVSTTHEEYRYFNNPALIANTPAEVSEAVREALQRRDELSIESWAFAEANGWSKRFKEAERLICRMLRVGYEVNSKK